MGFEDATAGLPRSGSSAPQRGERLSAPLVGLLSVAVQVAVAETALGTAAAGLLPSDGAAPGGRAKPIPAPGPGALRDG